MTHPLTRACTTALLALATACGGSTDESASNLASAAVEPPSAAIPAVEEAPVLPSVDPEEVRALVVERDTLNALEAPEQGWSFGSVLARATGANLPDSPRPDLGWMSTQVPAWAALADRLAADIDAVIAPIERPLVTELADAKAFPAGNVGRRLDNRWLKSPDAEISLAGVVNRLDRRELHRGESCGEVRLVYRLAYRQQRDDGSQVGSRLPLTFNVVMVPKETSDCASVAQKWVGLGEGSALVEELSAGPLDDLRLERIEVNAQVVRFPSGLETEFGGQALYLLKAYRFEETSAGVEARAMPLENTPDVAKLSADPALRAELSSWITENLSDIDQGTYRLPDVFLAKDALSWSTLGVNRGANHAFSALFLERLEELPNPEEAEGLAFVASQRGLLERLDAGTCTGCHQAASTAGFHLLGPDGAKAGVTNRLASPISPHLTVEKSRRTAYAAALASGQEPNRFRSHPLAPVGSLGNYATAEVNQPCLPDSYSGDLSAAANWSCASGSCEVVASDATTAINWGQCMPAESEIRSGQTCREGTLNTGSAADEGIWNQHAYSDTVSLTQRWEMPEDKTFSEDAYNCRPTRIGVPLGRTYRRCTTEERALTTVMQEDGELSPDICAVVGGAKFDQCVEDDFHACLEQIVGRGMVSTCSVDLPCREDMICQAIPWQLGGVDDTMGRELADAGVGFCTPTYFLFQLRLDGHPVPSEVL